MTGKNVATVAKRSQYPIDPDPASAALVDALVAFKNSDGSYDLRRNMTPAERRQLEARRNALVDNLGGCAAGAVIGDILEMLMGFGSGDFQTEETASAVAAQYAAVLASNPAWAVKRACGRWARGEVSAAEIGERSITRSRPPSAAQVKIVAEEIARVPRQELVRLNQTLKAGARPKPATDEERAAAMPRIRSMLDDVQKRHAEQALEETAARAKENAERDRRLQDWTRQKVRDEWVALGMDPPNPLFSVAMARSLGYEIMRVGERNMLLKPKPPEPPAKDWVRDGNT